MKKKTVYLKVFTALLVFASVFYLYSCKKENPAVQEKAPIEKKEILVNKTSARNGCSRPICFEEYICVDNPSGGDPICVYVNRGCFTVDFCIDFKLPECPWGDCGPWDFKKMLVNPIPNFMDYYKGDPHPEPNIWFSIYGINEKIALLQFNKPVKNVLDQEVFILDKAIELDKQTVLQQGLNGNVIPAGKYPVVFDKESNTFTAIVSFQ